MKKFTVLKYSFFASLISCALVHAGFDSFYKEFMRSGSGSPAFNSKNVKDFPSFYKAFNESGGADSPVFDPKKVKDFPTFWAEFKRSGCGSPVFDPKNVK